jgi:predicted phage terminase large subunit-like protein
MNPVEKIEPIRPQPKQELFLNSRADITFYGGSAGGGKTYSELMAPLINIDDPNFNAIFFRRTHPELIAAGGIWDTSKKIYPRFNAQPNETKLTWNFPSGSKIKFSHLQYDNDVHKHQSAAYPLIVWDEIPQFSSQQFFYLLSRNRAPTGYNKSCWCLAAGNAEPGWVADLISWWWDPQTGYAIPERSGVIRYFVRDRDNIIWVDKSWRDARGNKPRSITFIEAKLDDNQILKNNDPNYESNLLAQDHVTRERLLRGNWLITYSGGMFKREWFKMIKKEDLPKGLKLIRYWDWAATEAKDGKDPDYTVGTLCGMKDGDFYIIDILRFREAPGTTEQKLRLAAEVDGYETMISWEEELASAGKYNSHYLSGKLQGYQLYADRVSGDKIERGKPLASAAEHGHVYVVKAPWNNDLFIEAGQFGSGKGHKDIIDSLTGNHKVHTRVKRVWDSFSASQAKVITINWQESSSNTLHYGAFYQIKDSSIYFIAALWDQIDGQLYVYHAHKYESSNYDFIAMNTVKVMAMRKVVVNRLIGNDSMLTEKHGTAYYINKSIAKLGEFKKINSPTMWDYYGSIGFVGSLFSSESVVVDNSCSEMVSQIASWTYGEDGKKPQDNQGYCEALCLIASELKRDIGSKKPEYKPQDYKPVKETKQEFKETWQVA